jgi:hypothetical protein
VEPDRSERQLSRIERGTPRQIVFVADPGSAFDQQELLLPCQPCSTASRMAWVEESLKRFEVVLVSLKGTEFQILSASFEICDARYVERHFRRERSGEFFLSGRGHENINTKSFLI